MSYMHSVSQKIPPEVFDILFIFFTNETWEILIGLHTIIRSYLRWTANFYSITSNIDEVMPY